MRMLDAVHEESSGAYVDRTLFISDTEPENAQPGDSWMPLGDMEEGKA